MLLILLKIVNHSPSFLLLSFYLFICLFIYLWPCHMACGILVPRPGIETRAPCSGSEES